MSENQVKISLKLQNTLLDFLKFLFKLIINDKREKLTFKGNFKQRTGLSQERMIMGTFCVNQTMLQYVFLVLKIGMIDKFSYFLCFEEHLKKNFVQPLLNFIYIVIQIKFINFWMSHFTPYCGANETVSLLHIKYCYIVN